jgi:AraC-like DNA-binding protein
MVELSPLNTYAIENKLVLWRTRPNVRGLALCGHIGSSELGLLERAFDHGERDGFATPCDFIIDARRLRGLDSELYEALAGAVRCRLPAIQRQVRRHAVVRPAGLLGGAVSGFFVALDAGLEWRVFTDQAPALAWFGAPRPAVLAAHLDQLVARLTSGARLVDRVRDTLHAADRGAARLTEVSRALGVSPRSLQRALRELGTSFRDEVYRTRADTSRQLLRDTDDKIATIARRLGFSSEANFITFFRRTTGESPAAWRRRNCDVV